MDTYLAIASKRDERAYSTEPVGEDVVTRILDAGRLSGSSRNTQAWEFVLVDARQELAACVYAPENVLTAGVVVAVVGEARPFDVGRCAQNMMLAAWNEGVASCPNGVREADAAEQLLGGPVKAVLSFGYPERPRDVAGRDAAAWSARAKRKPLSETVRRV